MTRSLTQAEYETKFQPQFYDWLGATAADKDNLDSEVIAIVLDILGIQDREEFLRDTATTLGTVIYQPWEAHADLKAERDAHEGVHVLQYAPKPYATMEKALDAGQRLLLESVSNQVPAVAAFLKRTRIEESRIRAKGLGFMWLYLTEPDEERPLYEVHAYVAQMEYNVRRWGPDALPELDKLVERLKHGYDIGPKGLAFARRLLEVRHTEVANGVLRSCVALRAAKILSSIDPELLAA